jgi:uncharacterized protein (DUF1499 family)
MLDALGLLAAAALVGGPALAWLRLVPAMAGFGAFALGGVLALVVAVASIVWAARGNGLGRARRAAIVAAAVFMVLASRNAARRATTTTDPIDPPAFVHARALGANAGRDLAYPPAFAEAQHHCCADLRPARVAAGREEAFVRAARVAERMPRWSVTVADPVAGTIEAVVASRLFGFEDDVVIRVRAAGDGASRVDVRSKSRDGKGDLGVNAARIRAFVAALEGLPTTGRDGGAQSTLSVPAR